LGFVPLRGKVEPHPPEGGATIMAETATVEVRAVTSADLEYVRRSLTAAFGATEVAGHDELIDAATLPGAVARVGDDPAGLLTYRPDPDGGWEVVSLSADRPGVGAGRALIDWVRAEAARAGVTRLWLVTTNDNTTALRFYQRNGFDLVRLDRNAVDRARRLKPAIPAYADGIPIRHELELELRVTASR
jgi:ribosomal protein S18 acetylase RimI-like enzyme